MEIHAMYKDCTKEKLKSSAGEEGGMFSLEGDI